ncbi:hypothetical protein LEP1GSC052_1708 [Leptospira kmetyi serovar Malaysia str. Bejo-Iso9]|nr:hypothetical protein LEP1GSC052_1708 [Leptospira kmetyi serovar Malaysia str. Bejo-Iso9]
MLKKFNPFFGKISTLFLLVPGSGVETNRVRSGSAKNLFQNPVLQGFRVDAAILFFWEIRNWKRNCFVRKIQMRSGKFRVYTILTQTRKHISFSPSTKK